MSVPPTLLFIIERSRLYGIRYIIGIGIEVTNQMK